jgi:hypothetical protein
LRYAFIALSITSIVLTVTGVSCELPVDEGPVVFADSFENGLDAWAMGWYLPEDPNNPGQPVAWSIEQANGPASDGQYSARFFLDGRQDDGTIWLVRDFDVTPGNPYQVILQFDLWSESESANALAMVAGYAGGKEPDEEADFHADMAANLIAGWKTYTFILDTTATSNGLIRVAYGISAVWETEMTYYIDDVRIQITPQ